MDICVVLALTALCFALTSGRQVVDLTHTFDENAPKYPLGSWVTEDFNYFKMKTLLEQYVDEANKTW